MLRALLQVLDNGELRLANGQQKISFRNSYVFLTSNLALLRWQNVGDLTCGSSPIASGSIDRAMVHHLVQRALEKFFDPEFFNRIDETVILDEFDDRPRNK